ncbi:MAG: hypothetical protein AABX37_00435 [Nanoarchaeota archaeon]
MPFHLPEFETVLEYAVYAFPEQHPPPSIGHEPARTIITFSRFHLPSQHEVLEYLQRKADEVTSALQHSKETGETARFQGGIEWLLVKIPTDVRQKLASGGRSEELEKYLPESITPVPQPYLLLQGGTIPTRVINMGQSAQREKEWYNMMMRVQWNVELPLSFSESLAYGVEYEVLYQHPEQGLAQCSQQILTALYKSKPSAEGLKKITLIPNYKLPEIAESAITAFLEEKDKQKIFSGTTSRPSERSLHAGGAKN